MMKRLACALPILAALLSAGCSKVVSLQPLYTEGEAAPDVGLEGRWAEVDGKSLCSVARTDDGLVLTYLSDGDPAARYRIRPVRIGESTFLDLTAENVPDLAISGHWFARVERSGNELLVSPIQAEWVESQCTAGRLKCVKTSRSGARGDDLILTSPTPELRKVLLAPEAFGDTGRFRKPE
jgi:hypothetical protein